MANTITTQTIVDGLGQTVIKVNIKGDGSGDETKTVIYDASAYTSNTTNNALLEVEYAFNRFDGYLYWDADTDVPLIDLPANDFEKMCFEKHGGIPNNGGAGRTGDILLSTLGLASGSSGFLILRIRHKDVDYPR